MAGDPVATVLLLGLGLDELSVNPAMLPEIKKIIRSVKYRDARRIAVKILSFSTEEEIKEFLSSTVKNKVPQIPIE
jgi:phosphotransferase system enzyme I (PtsI)